MLETVRLKVESSGLLLSLKVKAASLLVFFFSDLGLLGLLMVDTSEIGSPGIEWLIFCSTRM